MIPKLPQVEAPDKYLDFALAKAMKRVSQFNPKGTSIERFQKKECERINTIKNALHKYLAKIHDPWPSIDELPEFYIMLIDHTLSVDELKHALGSIQYAKNTIAKLAADYSREIRDEEDAKIIRKKLGQFIGRVKSVFSRIEKNLLLLEKARKVIRDFPSINPDEFTVAIAGFPNVGKSTLLRKLTTAKPEIDNYAFTTKGLNSGSFEYKFSTIQFVDTPGTLGREKENSIEKLATITRQYIARLVIYVFDATEPYSLTDQQQLYKNIKEEGHDILLYLSKTDVISEAEVEKMKELYPFILTDAAQVTSAVKKAFNKYKKL